MDCDYCTQNTVGAPHVVPICGHIMHQECFLQWVKAAPMAKCPQCKSPMKDEWIADLVIQSEEVLKSMVLDQLNAKDIVTILDGVQLQKIKGNQLKNFNPIEQNAQLVRLEEHYSMASAHIESKVLDLNLKLQNARSVCSSMQSQLSTASKLQGIFSSVGELYKSAHKELKKNHNIISSAKECLTILERCRNKATLDLVIRWKNKNFTPRISAFDTLLRLHPLSGALVAYNLYVPLLRNCFGKLETQLLEQVMTQLPMTDTITERDRALLRLAYSEHRLLSDLELRKIGIREELKNIHIDGENMSIKVNSSQNLGPRELENLERFSTIIYNASLEFVCQYNWKEECSKIKINPWNNIFNDIYTSRQKEGTVIQYPCKILLTKKEKILYNEVKQLESNIDQSVLFNGPCYYSANSTSLLLDKTAFSIPDLSESDLAVAEAIHRLHNKHDSHLLIDYSLLVWGDSKFKLVNNLFGQIANTESSIKLNTFIWNNFLVSSWIHKFTTEYTKKIASIINEITWMYVGNELVITQEKDIYNKRSDSSIELIIPNGLPWENAGSITFDHLSTQGPLGERPVLELNSFSSSLWGICPESTNYVSERDRSITALCCSEYEKHILNEKKQNCNFAQYSPNQQNHLLINKHIVDIYDNLSGFSEKDNLDDYRNNINLRYNKFAYGRRLSKLTTPAKRRSHKIFRTKRCKKNSLELPLSLAGSETTDSKAWNTFHSRFIMQTQLQKAQLVSQLHTVQNYLNTEYSVLNNFGIKVEENRRSNLTLCKYVKKQLQIAEVRKLALSDNNLAKPLKRKKFF